MKTREELARDLEDKKQNKHLNEIQNYLTTFEKGLGKILKDVVVTVKAEELIPLKKAIEDIPTTIKSEHVTTVKHTTDSYSTKFLWYYFACSTIFLFISLGLAMYYRSEKNDALKQLKKEHRNGVIEGQLMIYDVLPKSSQKYLRDKYPNSRFE